MAIGVLAALGTFSLLSASSAQSSGVIAVKSLDQNSIDRTRDHAFKNKLQIESKAKFIAAAFIMVEHEPFSLAKFIQIVDTDMSVTRQAFVSVRGLPGESVYLTCGIERKNGGTSSGNRITRDCDGSEDVVSKRMMSGEREDTEIWLTDDLLPDSKGSSDSSISIEATYL